ncbi:unnamed protein product [Mytilus edulis]|uniref:Endonuclease/exonuclease/phosphatase domain-containing protein n=1 Tax=Mytilus edulis TaxID=6550 RepID=A0A8S3PT76_MYTED|nr:unnamed protein product [Mytilus edulis]
MFMLSFSPVKEDTNDLIVSPYYGCGSAVISDCVSCVTTSEDTATQFLTSTQKETTSVKVSSTAKTTETILPTTTEHYMTSTVEVTSSDLHPTTIQSETISILETTNDITTQKEFTTISAGKTPYCVCTCYNVTKQMSLEESINEIVNEIEVDKSKTSSFTRQHSSAWDSRKSSASIAGLAGEVLLANALNAKDNSSGTLVPPTWILLTGDLASLMGVIMNTVYQLTCTMIANFIGTIGHAQRSTSLCVKKDKDGHTHDGFDDDGDYGIGSRILDNLKEIDAHNITIIFLTYTSIWYSKDRFKKNNIILEGVKSVLRKISTDYILKEKIADENGRYLILTVEIDNTDFVFVNYYAPTKIFENEQIVYIEKIKVLLNERLDQNLVLGGDFNTILNPFLDKMGGSKYNTPAKYTSKLEDFIEEFELCDIWRTQNVDSRLYTWRQIISLIQCRLDFWLKSNFLSSSVTKTSIVPSIKSDHSLIKLTLSGENFSERGPGFWKFNSGLLTDKDYVDIVKILYQIVIKKFPNLENKNLKWDTIKSEIRGATVKYSKYKNMKLRERESNLKKRQDEIHKNLSRTYLDKDINTLLIELDIVKEDLEQIVNNQTRGAIIRSHAEHCEGNERNSKYFLSLEKRNYKNKCINKLVVNDIEILSQEKF